MCVYVPQANLSDFEKDRFYQELQSTVAKIPASEQLLVCGDWNGQLGSQSTGFEEVHGGQAIGKRNTEGERILEFAFAKVEETVKEKRRCFKLWKDGGSRAAYNSAKRASNRAVYHAKNEAENVALQKIDPRSAVVWPSK